MTNSWKLNPTSEVEMFNSRDYWNDEDNLIDTIVSTIAPHSDVYFSELCPIFSFEILKVSSLNLFSAVHFRDGAAFLLNFFLKHRSPNGLRTAIYINDELKHMVPVEWRENVKFIRFCSLVQPTKTKVYYLIGEDISPEGLEEVINLSKKNEIVIVPTITSEMSSPARSKTAAKLVNLGKKISQASVQVNWSIASLDELNVNQVKGTIIKTDPSLMLLCSDSYVAHVLLSLGACVENIQSDNICEIGLGYGFSLINHDDWGENEKVWKKIDQIRIKAFDDSGVNRISGTINEYLSEDVKNLANVLMRKSF